MRIGQSSIISFVSELLTSLIGFAATVFIARELGDDALGIYSLAIAVVVWLKIVSSLGIQSALRKRLSEPSFDSPLLTTGVLMQLVVFVLVSTVLYLMRGYLSGYLRGIGIPLIIGLFAANLSFSFITTVLEGQDRVHIASSLMPVERFFRSALQILLLLLGYGLAAMLVGYAFGAFVAGVLGAWFLSLGFAKPEREHVRSLASYAKYSWLTNFSNRAFASMDTLVLGVFVAEGLIGVYTASWNLASVMAVFGVSISRSMFPTMSNLSASHDEAEIGGLLSDALAFSGLLLIPGFVGAAIVGDLVLGIYGNSFVKGHVVLVILVFARTAYAYEDQLVNALNAADYPDVAFRIDAVFTMTNVCLNAVLIWQFGWIGAAVATLVSAFLGLALSYRLTRTVIPFSIPRREILWQVLAASGMGVVVLIGRLWLPDTLLVGIGLVAIGAATYFALLTSLSTRFRTVVVENTPV